MLLTACTQTYPAKTTVASEAKAAAPKRYALTGRIVFTPIIIQQAGVRGNVPGTLTA